MPAFLLRGKLAEPKPYDPRTNIDLDRLRSEAEELQKIVQNAISSEYDDAYSSAAEYVVTSLRGYDADVFLPLILAALGEPADPWPNLTRADIKRMTKGRVREAKHRRLIVGGIASLICLRSWPPPPAANGLRPVARRARRAVTTQHLSERPRERARSLRPPRDIRAEFAELGITPTPLAVIAHAFDAGLDETTAVGAQR